MTALLFASSATAYFFSGLICYIASFKKQNSYYSASRTLLFKASTKMWIAALWPIWIAKEIGDNQEAATNLMINSVSYMEVERVRNR